MGHRRARARTRRRAARAPPLRRRRLRRDLDRHLGPSDRAARRAPAALGRRPAACTGWTSPAAACSWPAQAAAEAGRAAGARSRSALNGDVDTPEGAETIRLLAARVRGRPARPRPARDALARARLDATRPSSACSSTPASPCGSASAAAATASAASTASTGAGPRATPSAARRAGSRRWASGALLVNCIPPDHVGGMLSWLRDFTDLPLGVYPNLGLPLDRRLAHRDRRRRRASTPRWRCRWRDEGAQIIGGCCGVGPEHVAAARAALARHRRRRAAARARRPRGRRGRAPDRRAAACRGRTPAAASSSRSTSPTSCASRACSCPPRAATWCGSSCSARASAATCAASTSAAAPACRPCSWPRNGAAHVHAIDVDQRAAQNTLTNAFRNGVADRVSAAAVDLYPWVPEERYDVIVASLYQTAGRPVRAGLDPPAARLLGPQPDRPPDRELPEALAATAAPT